MRERQTDGHNNDTKCKERRKSGEHGCAQTSSSAGGASDSARPRFTLVSVWCPIAAHSLECLTPEGHRCILRCNDNSDALESSTILLCIMGHLLRMPVGKLRQVEAKRKLSLCYVQQILILKVSRHGLTLGKKSLTFSQSSENSP